MFGNNLYFNYFIPVNKNLLARETPLAPARPAPGSGFPQIHSSPSAIIISVEERSEDPSRPPATMKTYNTIQLIHKVKMLFCIGLSSWTNGQIK